MKRTDLSVPTPPMAPRRRITSHIPMPSLTPGQLGPLLLGYLRRLGLNLIHRPIISISFLLLLLPLLTVATIVIQAPRLSGDEAVHVWPYFALCAANASVSLLALLVFLASRERHEKTEADLAKLRDREADHLSTILNHEAELELLSAMREMSRILNDDVRFERIWEEVLGIVQSLIHSKEVTIFLRDENNEDGLIPKVHHYGGRNYFGSEIRPDQVDEKGVREAMEYRSVFHVVEDNVLLLFFPLVVDGENIGVLKVAVPLAGDALERTNRIEECQTVLSDLLKHLSLAIKTPTLYEVAVLDQLTGLFTKRFFIQQITQLLKLSQRNGTPFSLLLLDIDHFKNINDTYGHLSGDIILRGVSELMQQGARETDSCYRYGGEEMCVLLPESSISDASALADRIRTSIEETIFRGERGEKITITASLGLATFESDVTDFSTLVSRADQSLYRAKDGGRNQVWRWEEGQPTLDSRPTPPKKKTARPKKSKKGRPERQEAIS